MDYEHSNFSISRCLFQEGSQQKLVGIPSLGSTITGPLTSPSKSSNHGTIITIAVAVAVLVAVVISAVILFLCIKKRNKKRREEKEKAEVAKEAEEVAERIRQGFDKAEVGAGADHARYEMTGSGPVPAWIKEKADLAEHPGTHELTGENTTIPELADRKRHVHEMYDASAAPVELPAEMPQELLASVPNPRSPRSTPFHSARQSPRIRSGPSSSISNSSSRPSPIDRRIGHTPQSRSSTLNSLPFSPSPPSQSGPSSPTDRSMSSSPRSAGMFGPISPIGNGSNEGRCPTEHIPMKEMLQSLSRKSPPPDDTSRGSQRGRESSLISSLRGEDSRRKRRKEF